MNRDGDIGGVGLPEKPKGRARANLIRSSGLTANDTTNLVFGVRIADELRELAADFVGGTVVISAFTPSGSDSKREGMFIIEIEKRVRRISIAISFPVGPDQPEARRMLKTNGWESCGRLPTRDDIRAASWDEAWLIVCEIGEVMRAKRICIGYGGYEF